MKKNTSTVTRFDLQNLIWEYEMEIRNRFAALVGEFEDLAPDDKWEKVKKVILDTAQKTLRSRKQKPKRNWINETLQMIEQIRELKEQSSLPTEEYKSLCKEMSVSTSRDKEGYIIQHCEDLENPAKVGDMRNLFQVVKKLTQPQLNNIKDKDGKLLTEQDMA